MSICFSSIYLKFKESLLWSALITFAILFSANSWGQAPNSFIFESKSEPKRVGDIKPAYLTYSERPLPEVSIETVLKRYIHLFENSSSPDVKIDALNRINNLRAKYGLSSKKLKIDKVKQSQAVLESYDRIVDSGVFYQRMDELLYQTAKATSFTGNKEDSIKRLKLLVGLYPQSQLYDESQFRIAESYFELGQFAKAAAEYKKLLSFSHSDDFHQRAKFKLSWALFRMSNYFESGKIALKSLDYYPGLKNSVDLEGTPELYHELIIDTFRLLSIMFSKQDDVASIEALQDVTKQSDYTFHLYDSLFRFYLGRERFDDAASVTIAYTENYPEDFYAYRMAVNTINSYKAGEFDIKEWNAKESFISKFGIKSKYWAPLSLDEHKEVKPHLLSYLGELAHLYFIRMQNSKKSEETHKHAVRASDYYLELAQTEPSGDLNGEYVYLAAQANAEANQFKEAIALYERSAYLEKPHKYSDQSGYAAVLTYNQLRLQQNGLSDQQVIARRQHIEKYASAFNDNSQTPALLSVLANELMEAEEYAYAVDVSDRVISHSKASEKQKYLSSLVNAHGHFALENYFEAEKAYQAALLFKKADDRVHLRERLAASIYRQAELAQDPVESARLFLKVVDSVPESSISSKALYDASVKQLMLEDWPGAIATLSHFQSGYPEHELYEDSIEKLIYAYSKNGELISAAEALVKLAEISTNHERARDALFQAAEYYQESEFAYEANTLYEKFTMAYPDSFDLSLESYHRVISFYDSESLNKSAKTWREKLVKYEGDNKAQRSERSSYLAANASFQLADESFQTFIGAKLSLPLDKALKNKRKLMNQSVQQYEAIAKYGVSEFMSAATFKIGEIYRQLAYDLMASERPNSLDELQLEQYDILLEEQAYPFEEKALEIYSINTEKVPDGYYDNWIARTYDVLAKMNPTEYARDLKSLSNAENIY